MSRIRANKITNKIGTGAIELEKGAHLPVGMGITGAGGLNITGVITATTISATTYQGVDSTALKDSGGNVKVQAQASGAVYTGIHTFNSDIDVDGHTNLDNVNVAGVTTFAGGITGTTATFSGNVSIGGTLTYEDVSNIDSVGLITAREGIFIPDSKTLHIGNAAGSGDLQLSHGGNSLIANNTGELSIIQYENNNDIKLLSDNGAGGVTNYIIADGGTGEVLLHHYGNEKIKTTNTGVTVTGTVAATSYTGDGSGLSGVSVGITTEALVKTNGQTASLDLTKDDHKVTATGTVTIDVTGGSEADSHTLRIVNSGIATVGFSTYFLFPSGGTPNLPTASGAISLISFTVHRAGAAGISTQLISGASVNFS